MALNLKLSRLIGPKHQVLYCVHADWSYWQAANPFWGAVKNGTNAKMGIKEIIMLLPQQNGQQLDPIVVRPLSENIQEIH